MNSNIDTYHPHCLPDFLLQGCKEMESILWGYLHLFLIKKKKKALTAFCVLQQMLFSHAVTVEAIYKERIWKLEHYNPHCPKIIFLVFFVSIPMV